jgi:hypothetical protein
VLCGANSVPDPQERRRHCWASQQCHPDVLLASRVVLDVRPYLGNGAVSAMFPESGAVLGGEEKIPRSAGLGKPAVPPWRPASLNGGGEYATVFTPRGLSGSERADSLVFTVTSLKARWQRWLPDAAKDDRIRLG